MSQVEALQSESSGTSVIRVQGVVREALPHVLYRVELDSGEQVLAHLAEPFRLHATRALPGDRVGLEISRLDWSRGRIVERLKA